MMSILPQASIAGGDELVGGALLGEVAGVDRGLARDLRGRLLGDVAVEVVDQHARALLGEQLRRRAADAAGRSGDDRHLAVEDSHGRSPDFVIREAAILHRLGPRRAPCPAHPRPAPRAPGHRAGAHARHRGRPRSRPPTAEPCPGDPIRLDQLTTGSFESSLQGGYVLVPFDVPAGTTAVRVKYCFDQPEVPTPNVRHTLDLGIYEPLHAGDTAAGRARVPRLGRLQPPGRDALARGLLDRGRVPRQAEGPRARQDHARLPARARSGPAAGTPSSAWPRSPAARSGTPTTASPGGSRSEYSKRPRVRRPAVPARPAISTKPKRKKAGWYTGDLHVHAEHSALGDATMRETFGYAFGKGKLDFITLTDYVTRLRLGRDRPLQDRPPPRRALLGGHHLPRAHEQPALRPLRRLPHRPGLRPRAPTAA